MNAPVLPRTIHELLVAQADALGGAPAIIAQDRGALGYEGLRNEVERTVGVLAAAGIGRGSRIALALPNEPEAATLTLSVLCGAICVPVNPAYGATMCESLLRSLHVDALIAPADTDPPAMAVALALGFALLRVAPVPRGDAGMLALHVERARPTVPASSPQPHDVAIVFHTSGTTSKPKIVSLTHAQLMARSRAQPVDRTDRCLFVPPIFTAGAFAHALLAPLAAGAAIGFARRPGEDALLDALEALRITCFSANPALLSSLRERLLQREPTPARALRFIRSSANALPPEQQRRLESAFGVPVIQGYGMTETGTIAQNPLPPRRRKPASVGVSVGPDIAIIDDDGTTVDRNVAGEIVVRGPGMMTRYEDPPEANLRAFHDGWFRTGDSGHLDEDGYLFITGRIKELINRGGMKVSPAEIDHALLRHPEVADAAAFGVPHPTLGEDVAAAVVLREFASVSEQQLREFAFVHLAPYKVPSAILRVAALPRSAAGKLNRGELTKDLAHAMRPGFVAPRDPREELVAAIVADVLRVERVGINDNFFQLGGDSLHGAQVAARVNAALGLNLGTDTMFRLPTVAHCAAAIIADESPRHAPPPLLPAARAQTKREG